MPKDPDAELLVLAGAIMAHDADALCRLLGASPALAMRGLVIGASRAAPTPRYFAAMEHYLYEGDTALHVAAAAHDAGAVRALVAAGARIDARNRRGAAPIHYAADGNPARPAWTNGAQEETVATLIASNASPESLDKSGVAPLHRAVRTRSTGAVRALLAGGADPSRKNKSGSTPMDLATGTTGRGGSGSAEAKTAQAEIIRLLEHALSARRRDGSAP